MKFTTDPADLEASARKLMELAASVEPVQDGRIHIEKINGPFLYAIKAMGSEFSEALAYAVERGRLELHESGTYAQLKTVRSRA